MAFLLSASATRKISERRRGNKGCVGQRHKNHSVVDCCCCFFALFSAELMLETQNSELQGGQRGQESLDAMHSGMVVLFSFLSKNGD